jgi:hypothetical protein
MRPTIRNSQSIVVQRRSPEDLLETLNPPWLSAIAATITKLRDHNEIKPIAPYSIDMDIAVTAFKVVSYTRTETLISDASKTSKR